MVFIESQDSLSNWLIKELSPICDADPNSLAKYVMALLRKPDKSDDELKTVCNSQLDVFLQANTKRFVEKLFAALAEKSYMPAEEAPPPAEPIPTPVVEEKKEKPKEDKDRSREERSREEKEKEKRREEDRKRNENREEKDKSKEANGRSSSPARPSTSSSSVEKDKDASRSRRAPLTGSNTAPMGRRDEVPSGTSAASSSSQTSINRRGGSPVRAPRRRISPPIQAEKRGDRRRSRSPILRSGRRVTARRSPPTERHRKDRRSRSRSPAEREKRRERSEEPVRKRRCKDYDEQGYCYRGDACPYDHGLDPVVVDEAAIANIVAAGAKGSSSGGPPIAAPPPSFNVPPPGYNPIVANPPPPGVDTVGYNPEAPGLAAMGDFSIPPPPIPIVGGPLPQWRPSANPYMHQGYDPSSGIPVDPHMGMMPPMMGGPMMRGRGRGRGRGGFHPYGRGGMSGVPTGGEMDAPKGKLAPNVAVRTLLVKKIPAELNNISKLNEHFEKFGSIVNMQVHYEGVSDTALITYSSRFEASQAYKSTEPIFNNRFIRVFWYQNVMGPDGLDTDQTVKTTTLASGVKIETPVEEKLEHKTKVPLVLPGPGQTSYKNPEMVHAKANAKAAALAARAGREQRLRLTDLHRRATGVVTKLHEQQKTVIMKMMKESDTQKKRTLNVMYKVLEKKIVDAKLEVEQLSEKLIAKVPKEGGTAKTEAEDEDDSPTPSPPLPPDESGEGVGADADIDEEALLAEVAEQELLS